MHLTKQRNQKKRYFNLTKLKMMSGNMIRIHSRNKEKHLRKLRKNN
jgi:hypothetical protein